MYGRPGAVYLDIPGNLVLSSIDEDQIPTVAPVPLAIPVSAPPITLIRQAAETIQAAKKPLVIVGKGLT